ncbi:dihydropteroate synthase [Halorhodospira abdelmalekii]|uniref:dihydropteroate synthase n=1 Tax=Halorhodospira abdelmalekii TaxID=421629 RepID=UPI00190421A5|nr:dihydropteroate synthase [Halorhodospira abdelmalekii]MBK1734258.1 dihydropteroate synthase [Halorhodospira abdelmalekii]
MGGDEQAAAPALDCAGYRLPLDRPLIMGVINVTPDSFSDGGRFLAPRAACRQAHRLVAEGADLLDIGGESSRPGAEPVSAEEELERVVPVLEALRGELEVPISVDTCKPAVARAAVAAGAAMINDIRALEAPGALAEAAAWGVPICLMHMQGEPRTMQRQPHYDDLIGEVRDYLAARVAAAQAAGVPRERLVVDPGFGFGKSVQHNYALLHQFSAIVDLGLPVLVGMSRKSMIGWALGERPAEQRVVGSAAAAALAVWQGARIVRTHDVAATVDAVAIAETARRVGSQ